jgi:hypothetical protein
LKPLLLTFDLEEFDLPNELGRALSRNGQVRASAKGLRRILPLLRRHETPATFFVTGAFATARPAVVRSLSAAGHEIGVHGLEHSDDYATLPRDEALERLRRARRIVEDAAGQKVSGVRTPRLRPCSPAVLHAAGFTYDASPHPTWIPGRYNGLTLPRRPWKAGGILHLPISVLPGTRVPVSWLWYRLAGPRLGRVAARCSGLGAPYVHLYFHPWEALSLRPFGVPSALALRSGAPFLRLLDVLLFDPDRTWAPMTLGRFARRYEPLEE